MCNRSEERRSEFSAKGHWGDSDLSDFSSRPTGSQHLLLMNPLAKFQLLAGESSSWPWQNRIEFYWRWRLVCQELEQTGLFIYWGFTKVNPRQKRDSGVSGVHDFDIKSSSVLYLLIIGPIYLGQGTSTGALWCWYGSSKENQWIKPSTQKIIVQGCPVLSAMGWCGSFHSNRTAASIGLIRWFWLTIDYECLMFLE